VPPIYFENRQRVAPGTPQSQFINNNDPTAKNWDPDPDHTYHSGLCGQGALAVVLRLTRPGVSLNEVVSLFVRYVNSQPDYNGTTNLGKLVDAAYPEWYAHYDRFGGTKYGTYWTDWANSMESFVRFVVNPGLVAGNRYVLTSVLVGGSTGRLSNRIAGSQFENQGNADHWVTITGISNQWNRHPANPTEASPWKWVRIHNPFDNQPEYYWWPDFEGSWDISGGNVLVLDRRRIPNRHSDVPY
jgi:hypothetical protein